MTDPSLPWINQVQVRLAELLTGKLPERQTLDRAVAQLLDEGLITPPPMPSEADQLWTGLATNPTDQILGAVLIAKVFEFETGATEITLSATEDVDWVTQLGLIQGAANIMAYAVHQHGGSDEPR